MSTAAIIIVVVVGLLVGGIMTLRSSTKTGMPTQDVLDRATRRARQLDEQEKKDEEPGAPR
jgi:Protein of unknown function (DUF2897)